MPESPFRENLAYLRRHGTVGAELAAASGLGAAELSDLERAGVVPQPTYRVGEGWVESAIGHCGRPDGPPVETYYGPAVVAWLQRAAVLARLEAPDVRTAMLDWLARDLAEALAKAGADAEKYGWSHVLRDGRPDRALVRAEVDSYWAGWMRGGWAVCLRRFDGHHLAVKEIERRRLAAFTRDWTVADLGGPVALAVVDAMRRLDSVLMPFAPCERATGTPGLYLDRTGAQYGLPWPVGPDPSSERRQGLSAAAML